MSHNKGKKGDQQRRSPRLKTQKAKAKKSVGVKGKGKSKGTVDLTDDDYSPPLNLNDDDSPVDSPLEFRTEASDDHSNDGTVTDSDSDSNRNSNRNRKRKNTGKATGKSKSKDQGRGPGLQWSKDGGLYTIWCMMSVRSDDEKERSVLSVDVGMPSIIFHTKGLRVAPLLRTIEKHFFGVNFPGSKFGWLQNLGVIFQQTDHDINPFPLDYYPIFANENGGFEETFIRTLITKTRAVRDPMSIPKKGKFGRNLSPWMLRCFMKKHADHWYCMDMKL